MRRDISHEVQNDTELTANDRYHWGFEYGVARDYLIPYLHEHSALKPNSCVADIGCAEAGVLHACISAGASGEGSLGTDIDLYRMGIGEKIDRKFKLGANYTGHNILTESCPEQWKEMFDLAILRDVIEHLDDTALALANVSRLLRSGGHFFCTFPPYNSPFGGHQQTLDNALGKIPYIHLLPDSIFHRMIASGRAVDIVEVKRLQAIKLSPKKFLDAVRTSPFEVVDQEYYLLRPAFKYRLRKPIPTIRITSLVKIFPFFRDLFSLEAAFLLRKK